MSFIGATGLDEVQEQFDTLNDKIDANADYINNLVGIPDPTHTAIFGINILNPGLFGLVERAEVNIAALQTGEEGLTAQIEAIDTQIAGIEGEITGIQGEIAGIQGEITGIQGEITGIQFTEIPALSGAISAVAGVAGDALVKANKSLGIWDEDGNNTYNMKSGNVAIGILPKGTILNNKLEVNGSINIPSGSKYKINNVDLSYNDLTNKLTAGNNISIVNNAINNTLVAGTNISIVGNAINNTLPFTTIAHDIFTTNLNNFGIGNTLPAQKLDVNGSINITLGSKYKINNIDLSYNDLTNKLTAGDRITIANNVITAEAPYASEQYSGRIPIREYGTGVLNYPANFAFTLDGITIKKSTLQPDVPNNVIYVPQPDWNVDIIGGSGYIYNKPTLFDGNYNSLTNKLTAGTNISIVNNAINNTLPITINANNIYTTNIGNVGIGTSILNNKLEVAGNINIPTGSKYKINNVDLSYNDLTNKLTAGTNISIVGNAINNTYSLPTASTTILGGVKVGNNLSIDGTGILSATAYTLPTASTTILGGVKVDGSTITINGSGVISGANTYTLPTASTTILGGVKVDGSTITINGSGVISSTSTASGASISLDGSTNNRSYGWTGSTSLLGRVGVAGNYAIGSLVEDVVLRSQGRLLLQSGTNNPALTIETTTNNILVRNSIGIGTTTISSGNLIDVGGFFKVAFNAPVDALTLTSTGVQVNNTLNVSSGFNNGGIIRLGGFSDDSSLDLATIQNREYATNKSELLIFKGDNIEGLTGVDRIRLRAGAIAFDTFATDATTSATTENIRMFINGNGDVGIGTTQPTAELDIVGVNSGFGTTLDILNMRYDASWGLKFVQNLTIAGNIIYNIVHRYNAVNNTLMTFSNANVGIGTTSPETTFDINGNLLVRAYEAGTGGTKGVFFRTGFISTNQYNCSILAYDHNAASAANGLSINGFGGVSFCTGANTRQERLRITQGGNVGIGITNPVYKLHFKTTYDNIPTGFHLDADDGDNNPNKYALTLYPYVVGSGSVGWRFRTQSMVGGTRTPLQFDNVGNITIGGQLTIPSDTSAIWSGGRARTYYINNGPSIYWGNGTGNQHVFRNSGNSDSFVITDASQIIVYNGIYQRNQYDALLYTDSAGMYLCFGNIGDGTNSAYLKISASNGHTNYESNQQRSHRFYVYQNVFSGVSSVWQFVYGGASYNGLNSSVWNTTCDHRIKENIVKADLKNCYDNIKNINLYRYNYIDSYETSSKDKNKLGYIAQEVKKHFPKAIHTEKTRLKDKREVPDLLTIDVEQINLTLYGAVKQLIKIVEKQNKRIKALETLLNIDDNDDVEDDAGQPYERIYDENEIDINTIEPTEPPKEV